MAQILQGLILALGLAQLVSWWRVMQRRHLQFATNLHAMLIGFVTSFFDALGIGNFATTTAWFKLRRLVPDEAIPGTLNVGHSMAAVTAAVIYIALVEVDVALLFACVLAAALGAWFGAGIVARLSPQWVRIGMGVALLVGATLLTAANMEWTVAGGTARSVSGGLFWVAAVGHMLLGALMTLGIGLYAPSLIMLSLMGLDPQAVFPIMMGACALLQPTASLRFLQGDRWSPTISLGLTLGGVPAVLIAAYAVTSLPLKALRWLVVVAVLYAAVMMLRSAIQHARPTSAVAT